MTPDQVTAWLMVLTSLVTALATLRGRGAWHRLRARVDGIPRCPVCAHRCAHCKATSDPPPTELQDL